MLNAEADVDSSANLRYRDIIDASVFSNMLLAKQYIFITYRGYLGKGTQALC